MIQPTFLNLHPNELVKDFVTMYLWLIYIDVLEVVIIFMIFFIEYVLQKKIKRLKSIFFKGINTWNNVYKTYIM